MKKITLFALFAFLFAVSAFSQQFSLFGKVIDSATKAPLSGASAFCPNTTYGTISNADGLFFLKLPDGGYDLIVSYTGYEKKGFRISNTQTQGDTLLVELVKQDKVMEEVAVVASNEVADGWTKYGQFFTDNFIGTSPNAAQCKLLNPEALRFFYTKKRNRLKVTAREDLIIYNTNLGYTIRYQLDSFNYDYNTLISQFTGYPLFTEIDTTVEARSQFIKNRARTYLGSRLHFMRSFYNSTVSDEGFIVEKMGRDNKPDLITNLYTEDQYGLDSGEVVIGWQGKYRVSYKSVLPDKKFLAEFKLAPNTRYQTTIVDVLSEGFVIERNGYFYEQYEVINTGYWAWKKLAEALPYDYVYQ